MPDTSMRHIQSPVLILDIDGVLNGHEWCHGSPGPRLRQDCVERLQYVMTQVPDTKVVLASQWRHAIAEGIISLQGFEWAMKLFGLRLSMLDILPYSSEVADRDLYTIAWISNNLGSVERPRVPLCVLDDLELPAVPKWYHVRPHPSRGLEWYQVSTIIELLKGTKRG